MHIPTRRGVGPTCVFLPAGPWPTVLDFLVERMPNISREAWAERLRSQLVLNAQAQPVPVTAAKLLTTIGRPVPTSYEGQLAWSTVGTGSQVEEKCILFPPIEPPPAPSPA